MPAAPLWHWRYRLRPRATLNARAGMARDREGALIRDAGGGTGCLHPWPELGDAPLEAQLAALAAELPTRLGRQALRCAAADGAARREGRNLFAGLQIPPSHWSAGPDDDPAEVAARGFAAVKLKGGPDLEAVMRRIRRWREGAPGLRLRLDFNDTLAEESCRAFWAALDPGTRAAVEFIEDPLPWDADAWRRLRQELGLPLAADRDLLARAGQADWLVVKPACLDPAQACVLAERTGQRLVFTSAMDHAIGQLHAAWQAARLAPSLGPRLAECGLLTHPLYEPDAFFERLDAAGPRLLPPGGTGLGYDDLLEALPWKRLI